jgi:hypothetical protein
MGQSIFSRRLIAVAVASTLAAAPAASYATTTVFRMVIKDLKAQVALAAGPSALNFGGINVGQTGSSSITVSNAGGTAATGVQYQINPPTSAFTLGGNCSPSLGPGETCTETVTFTPTAGQTYSGTFTVSGASQSSNVSLNGTGLLAQDQMGAGSLTFAAQQVGTTSGAQTVTLYNPGNTSLGITNIYPQGPYAVTHNCGSSLAAGATCSINVTFTPTGINANPGDVYVVTSVGTPVVTLAGTGQQAILAVSPTSVAFGNVATGQSSVQSITLTNSGNIPATSLQVTPPTGYTQSNTCSGSVAANGSCTVNLTFSPTASVSYNSASVSITSSAATVSVPVTGTGVCAGGSQLFTASGTFTPVAGCSTYLVMAVGGGGGGGYSSSPSFRMAGGGSGNVNIQYDNGISSAIPVTIGSGAAAQGGQGGTSCFGSAVCAAGGYTYTSSTGSSSGGSGGADASNGAATGGTGGGNSTDGFGKGQGAWATYIALFKKNSITSGAGGATVYTTNSLSNYAGGGGGGILINGAGPSGVTGSGGGTGGAGYGGGGGGPAVNTRGASYQQLGASGAGANGVVYVEWSQ